MHNNKLTPMPVFRCNATQNNENINPAPNDIHKLLIDMKTHMETLNKKIDDQAKSIAALTQNLATNNILMKQMMDKVSKKVQFPICNIEQLDEIESDISKNKEIYVNIFKNIVQAGLSNGMKKILTDEVMVAINYDGLQDKVAFKKFECFNNALFEAVQTDGYTKVDFIQELKTSFKKGKNRHHKAGSLKRKNESTNG